MKRAYIHMMTICAVFLLALVTLAVSFAAGDIGISPDQKDQLKTLATSMRQKSMHERAELMRARRDLFEAYRSYDLDEKKVKSALDRIASSQLDLLNMHLENQIALRRILNSSQFQRFQSHVGRHPSGSFMGEVGPENILLERLSDRDALENLGLNSDQVRRLRDTLQWPQRRKVMEKLRRDSRDMLELYSQYDLDVSAAKKLISSIHDSQTELLALNRKSQEAIRSILTPAQFQNLQDQIEKRMRNRPKPRGK